jgi:hypothetical protein
MQVTLDVRNTPPGSYTIGFRGQAAAPPSKELATKEKRNVALVQPSSPVTIHVVPQNVGTVSLSSNTLTLKPGSETALTVKVNRQNDYQGAFRVQLVVPPDVKGVDADSVEIPAGKNEAKLTIKTAGDAAPGSRAGLIVRVKATIKEKLEIKQDVKLNLTVAK